MKGIFTLKKNVISLLLRELVNKGALLIMVFFIARLLGKAELGQYTLALTVSQILFFATDLGLNTLLVREVAKDNSRASEYLFNFGVVNFIVSAFTLVLVGLVAWFLNCPKGLVLIIYLCAFSYFIIRLIVLFEAVFRALEKMEYQLFASLFKNLIFISLGVWYLLEGGALVGLFCIFLLTNVITLLAIGGICARVIKFAPPKLDIPFLKKYLIKTFPIWLTQLFAIIYLKVATLFLYRMKGDEAVGVYNAGYVLVDGFLILSGVFASAIFPLLSRLHSRAAEDLKRVYEKCLNFLVFLFLPVAVSAVILSHRLVPLFYGSGFEDTVMVMRILSCTAFLVIFGPLNSYVIITLDKQKIMPYICGFGLVLSLVLNVSLIPALSFIGAAVSGLMTELVMFSTVMLVISKYIYKLSFGDIFFKSIVASLAIGIFVYLFREINMFILVTGAAALYLMLIYLLKGFLFQEKEFIKKVLRVA